MPSDLYERDFHAWTAEQATLLRSGDVTRADLAHIAEEIESMGRSERRELVNRLAILLLHLLKWRYQPALRSTSWQLSVREQRRKLRRHLDENPSLVPRLPAAIADAYGDALLAAERETGLPAETFPADCPFSDADIQDDAFWP